MSLTDNEFEVINTLLDKADRKDLTRLTGIINMNKHLILNCDDDRKGIDVIMEVK